MEVSLLSSIETRFEMDPISLLLQLLRASRRLKQCAWKFSVDYILDLLPQPRPLLGKRMLGGDSKVDDRAELEVVICSLTCQAA